MVRPKYILHCVPTFS